MTNLNPSPLNVESAELRRAEDIFVALARSYDMMFYLGRLSDATDEELRSVYGLTIAALRQSSRTIASVFNTEGSAAELMAARAEDEVLASRLEQMTTELALREERIRELTTKLEKRRNQS